jgi:signal peptidase I
VFVLGDNRRLGASVDSRSFGVVAVPDVAGRVVWRVWPPAAFGRP